MRPVPACHTSGRGASNLLGPGRCTIGEYAALHNVSIFLNCEWLWFDNKIGIVYCVCGRQYIILFFYFRPLSQQPMDKKDKLCIIGKGIGYYKVSNMSLPFNEVYVHDLVILNLT